MADEFSKQLSTPGAVTGSTPTHEPIAGAIGGALSGLADIFDVGLKEYHKDRVEKAGLELENQLTPLAQAVGQGKMTSDEMLMRSSNLVSSAINKNPHLSAELRSRAQTVLGVLPTAEIVKGAQKDEDVIKNARVQLKVGFAAQAAKSGVGVLKDDGSLDIDKSAEQGQILSAADEKMKRLGVDLDIAYKNAEIQRARQGTQATLSLADKHAISIGEANKILTPTVNARLNSMFQNMGKWMDANQGLKEPQQEAAAKQEWARQKFAINQMVENYIAGSDHAFDSEETHNIRQNVNEMLEKYDSVFTGPFSNIKVNTEMVQNLKNGSELDFHRTAPTAAMLTDIAGGQAANTIVGMAFNSNSRGNTLLQNEGVALVDHFTKVIQDPSVPTTEPRQLEVIQSGVNSVEQKGAAPEPKELSMWGNGKQNLLDTALSSKNPTDYRNAADLMSTPSALSTLDQFSKDPTHQAQAQVIGRKLLQLNTQNILKNGLQTQQVTNPGEPSALAEFGGPPGPARTFTPVYNPTTGAFEVQSNQPGGVPPENMARNLRSMNNSLKALEQLQPYGNDQDKSMDVRQFKQSVVQGAGIPLKAGETPVEMPGEKQSSKAAAGASPKVNTDFANGFPSLKGMKALGLNKQEAHLYEHHINNLTSGNAVINPDGSVSTIKNVTFEIGGKVYVIPTIWDGKELSPHDALQRASEEGIKNWPSYKTEEEARQRYDVKMHDQMEKDVHSENFQAPDNNGIKVRVTE